MELDRDRIRLKDIVAFIIALLSTHLLPLILIGAIIFIVTFILVLLAR